MKDSNILSGSEDDKNSEASNRSGKASNKEDKSVKPSQQNDETTDLKMMKSKDQIEDKDDQSTKKQP